MPLVNGAYRSIGKIIVRYWRIYGGHAAIFRSPYFHLSFVLLILTSHTWLDSPWWDVSISVLPNLLGFTLGGFAIFLGFGDDKFKGAIAGNDPLEGNSDSPYMSVSSTFLHFVVIQVVALLWALVAKGLHFEAPWPAVAFFTAKIGLVGDLVGYWLFLYGICLSAASGVAIFRVAGWYDALQTKERKNSALKKDVQK